MPHTETRAFFVSPIGEAGSTVRDRSDKVLDYILRPALLPEIVTHIERGDENPNPGEITSAIIASILESELIVADLSDSNPNVYYEVALAHAYGKPVIHIRESTNATIPFDIKDIRVFDYSFDVAEASRAKDSIARAAEVALSEPHLVQTPVDRGRVIAQGASSSDIATRTNANILERLDQIDSRMSSLIHRVSTSTNESPLSTVEEDLVRHIRLAAQLLATEGPEDSDGLNHSIRSEIINLADMALSERVSRHRREGMPYGKSRNTKQYPVQHTTGEDAMRVRKNMSME